MTHNQEAICNLVKTTLMEQLEALDLPEKNDNTLRGVAQILDDCAGALRVAATVY